MDIRPATQAMSEDLESEHLYSCECPECGRLSNEGQGCHYCEERQEWVCDTCGSFVFEYETK